MKHEHAIVVDAKGYKVEFVVVHIDEDTGQEYVDSYELRTGESLVYSDIAHALGMLKPHWNGKSWNETATDEELAAAEPEPIPNCTDPRDKAVAELSTELAACHLAIAELSIAIAGGEK